MLVAIRGSERERLIQEYHEALKKYSEAVSFLARVDGQDCDRAYREVEALHEASERCQVALENHK